MACQWDRPLRVRCMTYNTNRGKADENLFKLVFDHDLKDKSQLADIYVIGFQELAGLHLTFHSWTGFALNKRHESMIWALLNAARSVQNGRGSPSDHEENPSYKLLTSASHGGLGLLVYAKEDTVLSHIKKVETSSASCGFFNLMNNKGAVGVRVFLQRLGGHTLQDQDNSTSSTPEESFTFINAHLTAHDSGILARNRDYQTILNRLLFPAPHGYYHTIYDTNHLFFMGDLNYRISLTSMNNEKSITKQVLSDMIQEGQHGISLLFPQHDTLFHQHSSQQILIGLKEAMIKFKPTYKYKRGRTNEFVSFDHRLPGWTDRIFYASSLDHQSSTDQKGREQQGVQVIEYQSIQEYQSSDHKPVFLVIDLPKFNNNKLNYNFLSNRPLITIDKRSSEQKEILGFLLDQSCGIILLSVAFLGFGNLTLGFVNLVILIGFIWGFYTT